MRAVIGCAVSWVITAGVWATPPLASRAAATDEKPRKESSAAKAGRTTAPTAGIKTPGVRIAYDKLKPEATIAAAAKPKWIFFSDSVFFPNANGLDRVDPKTNKLADPIAGLKQPCGGMTSAFKSLWVPVCGDGSLARLDPKTYKAIKTLTLGASPVSGNIAASTDSIWLLTDARATLLRIDPDTNEAVGEVRLPPSCHALTFGETALWVACPAENHVLRINPVTNLVEKRIDVSAQPDAIVPGDGSLWVLCRKEGKIDRIDPKTNKVTKTIELSVPGAEGELAFGEGSLWVTMRGFPLTRINTQDEAVVQQFYGEGGGAMTTGAGALWLVNTTAAGEGSVSRVDPKLVKMTLAE